ncbi:hypothetical protein [Fictibacillus phosphorivorans]|uniref:hypothetical protein n=1 Tax=Fictibacillus phosphorivorans TaxID=1221500 RepID=UPI0011AAA140|nr:hypothetical protein [Fictibacillus phosphorivorans]
MTMQVSTAETVSPFITVVPIILAGISGVPSGILTSTRILPDESVIAGFGVYVKPAATSSVKVTGAPATGMPLHVTVPLIKPLQTITASD